MGMPVVGQQAMVRGAIPPITTDTTGFSDTRTIQGMLNLGLPVSLGAGDYYLQLNYQTDPFGNPCALILPQTPVPMSVIGWRGATVLHGVGTGVGISAHRTTSYGSQYGRPAQQGCGALRDFRIDGALAGAGSIGLSLGDGWGYSVDIDCVNFTAAGSIGAYLNNAQFWSEKHRVILSLMNNAIAAVFDQTNANADGSHEYNWIEIYLFAQQGQQGVVVQNGCNLGGVNLWISGNMAAINNGGTNPNNLAALTFTGQDGSNNYSRLYFGELHLKVEANNPNNYASPVYPYGIYFGAAGNAVKQCCGRICHTLANSVLNGGEFSFRGLLAGDPNLAKGWPSTALPAYSSGSATWQNTGPDAVVVVGAAAGVTGIQIGGVSTGISTGGGVFFIPAGGTITINGSGAQPSFTVCPAAFSQF